MRFLSIWALLALVPACLALAADEPSPKPVAPAWTQAPERVLSDGQLAFIGKGEDRHADRAYEKAVAYALQNLANECSLIPLGTSIESEASGRYDEALGILHRSFAKVSISQKACDDAKAALKAPVADRLTDKKLLARLLAYQKIYDTAEPDESEPIYTGAVEIHDDQEYFVRRQQVAISKQTGAFGGVVEAMAAIRAYEKAHPGLLTGTQAFSTQRPHWVSHQASALWDTIDEQMRIKNEYPVTPHAVVTPDAAPSSDSKGAPMHEKDPRNQ